MKERGIKLNTWSYMRFFLSWLKRNGKKKKKKGEGEIIKKQRERGERVNKQKREGKQRKERVNREWNEKGEHIIKQREFFFPKIPQNASVITKSNLFL